MGEITQPIPHLDLKHLETSTAKRSPRSKETRAGPGVKKPVELLIRSLHELVAESHGHPYEAVTVMHETYDKERRKLLHLCRDRGRTGKDGAGEKRSHLPELKVVGKAVRRSSTFSSTDVIPSPQDFPPYGKPPCSTTTTPSRNCGTSFLRPVIPNQNNNNNNSSSSMVSTSSGHSLGDLRHSPATQTQLEKLTGDVRQKMRVTVSEKDRKIAALMLVKHRQETERLSLRKQEERQREEARGEEAVRRAQEEKARRRSLRHSLRRWRQATEALSRSRERRHQEAAAVRRQQALLQEEHRLRSREEQEARRKEAMEATRREAQSRKRCQERLLRGRVEAEEKEREKEARRALEREQRADKAKEARQRREKERLSQENRRELLQHLLLKQRGQQQALEEEALARRSLEKRLRRSWEVQVRASEGRRRELRDRGSLQAELTQQARAHAQQQHHQQLRRKTLLVQLSQGRTERAVREAAAQVRAKAQQAQRHNLGRRLGHQQLLERLRREEAARREALEGRVMEKERRRRALWARREQTQEEARRAARASFHVRDSAREQTAWRTFNRMALEAQLCASLAGVRL